MIYIVWTRDEDNRYGRFSIFGNKKSAVAYANGHNAESLQIVYLRLGDVSRKDDFDPGKTIVIQQRISFHFGA